MPGPEPWHASGLILDVEGETMSPKEIVVYAQSG